MHMFFHGGASSFNPTITTSNITQESVMEMQTAYRVRSPIRLRCRRRGGRCEGPPSSYPYTTVCTRDLLLDQLIRIRSFVAKGVGPSPNIA